MSRFPQPGAVLLGKYRVISLIGEGGMGAVIKAKHIDLDEDVAIKCLLPEMMSRDDIVRRFLREAKAAVKLKGLHVARVHDVGRLENEVPFIVMEFLEGADLNAIIKHHGAQEPAVAVDLILQACEAIAEAHSMGIIHRDIKASNFFITQPDGEAPVLKVLDFGIATAPEGASELTSTQSVIGTPAYMAPEQMRSSKIADVRSDIWSMGVVLYELLEGARPFRSEVYSDLCLKVGMDPPEAITNPNVPDSLRAVVMKCLEKPIERRYQSVAELAFDLMPYASDPVQARVIVEQCARLLGRRSTKMFEAAAVRSEDTTPMPKQPMRITPVGAQTAAVNPEDLSDVLAGLSPAPRSPSSTSNSGPQPSLLGRPTPLPNGQPKTPTSIQGSNGEVSLPSPPSRRRGLLIGLTAATLVVIGGVAMFAFGGGDGGESVQPAANPALDPEGPTVKATDVEKIETPDPAKTEDPKPAKTEDPKPAKTEDPKTTNTDGSKTVETTKKPITTTRTTNTRTNSHRVVRNTPKNTPKKDKEKDPPKDPPKDPTPEPGGSLFKNRE